MKRKLAAVLALAMLLTTGCGSGAKGDKSASTQNGSKSGYTEDFVWDDGSDTYSNGTDSVHVSINTDMGFAFDNLDTLPDDKTGVTAVVLVDLDENKDLASYKFLNSKQVKDFMQDQVDYTNKWDMYFRETRPNRVYWTTCEKSKKDAEASLTMFCLNKITNDIYLYTESSCFHD